MEHRENTSNIGYLERETLASWNDQNYKIIFSGDEIKVVILGERHYDKEILNKQLQLIEIIKPEFVLYEFLSGMMYHPDSNTFEQQPKRKFNIVDSDIELNELAPELLDLSRKLGFKIIGCDLTLAEMDMIGKQIAENNPDIYTFDEEFEILSKIEDPDWFYNPQSEEIIPYRDQKMVEILGEYQQKSKKPIISIMGDHHAKNIHTQKLIQNTFGYAYVNQTEKNSTNTNQDLIDIITK